MPRTTLQLEDDAMKVAQAHAHRHKLTLGQAVSDRRVHPFVDRLFRRVFLFAIDRPNLGLDARPAAQPFAAVGTGEGPLQLLPALAGDPQQQPGADVVQFAGMMIMMPLMFLSAAFAPLSTMPDWLRTIATFNPVAHAIGPSGENSIRQA